MTSIFEQKAEQKRLAKQFDSLSGAELNHIRVADRALYDRLCESKGIIHSYPVAKDYRDLHTPERVVSVEAAQATQRFSPEEVHRYKTQTGNADNLNNLAKNDPEGYKLFKLADATYESLKPAPARGRIRPIETAPTPTVEPYQRLKPPTAPSNESEHTVVGEHLGKRLNLPPETKVSFEDYSSLLVFAARLDQESR